MQLRSFAWAIMPLMCSGLGACTERQARPVDRSARLNVFAAVSLAETFTDLGRQFESAHSGTSVVFNFAGSQQIREQLAHGAPADVFASANRKEMDAALSVSLVDGATIRTFARNKLIVIYPRDNPARITRLTDLARSGLKLDVADPAVPVGKYTEQMLDRMSRDAAFGPEFKSKVLANVVSREDNVKSVVTKVRLGEADAGVVYATDVTENVASEVGVMEVPTRFNQTAEYPIAVTANAASVGPARLFVEYVLSDEGQEILKRHGFIPAKSIAESVPATTTFSATP